MAKKQKRRERTEFISKRQLSKWQRQMKIRRIIIIAAVAFLAGILGWVGFGYYQDEVAPFHEVIIRVNDASFTMGYYIDMLDLYTRTVESEQLYSVIPSMADVVANNIINAEVTRQHAKDLGIEVSSKEVDAKIKENKLPNEKLYRDVVGIALLQEKLQQYFESQLPQSLEQAQVQVMLVESQEVAKEVMDKIKAGGNFTALVNEFSCSSQFNGDLGWLPKELMPNALIAEAAFNLSPGEMSQPIYDESAAKNVGYWLIELSERKDDEIKARAILLGSGVEADQVRAELASGADFASLAEKYSQHESKAKGGDLGWLKPGDMDSQAFDQVAFNLTPNEVSAPVKDTLVQTTGGYWIVKLVARDEHPLEGQITEALRNKHWNDWFEEQKNNSDIENLLDEQKKSSAITQVLQRRQF